MATARAPTAAPKCDQCGGRAAAFRHVSRVRVVLCRECFVRSIEDEVHSLVVGSRLIVPGDRIALAVSGGKDSTALAHVITRLNARHSYGAELVLLSIDEGIVGYRDDSLAVVRRNREQYGLPLTVASFKDMYGYTMDEVAQRTGGRNTCSFCGVFRRQAFDRGALAAGCTKVATGHNADDTAETVLLNLMRGDTPRLQRCRGPQSTAGAGGSLPRIKPFLNLLERDIVMYAHFERLDYFGTECKYAGAAYRGVMRTFLKDLERVSPTGILDIVHSGETFELARTGDDGAQQESGQGACTRCGYVTNSKGLCKACSLVDTLNSSTCGDKLSW